MESYAYKALMQVRDYECDMNGHVNNSVYQNYLEHIRHEYLKSIGIDFADFARSGNNMVVVRVELDYKAPLTSGDEFTVGLNMRQESKIRFAFYQDIIRNSDQKLALQAKVIGTVLNSRGRPEIPEELLQRMAQLP